MHTIILSSLVAFAFLVAPSLSAGEQPIRERLLGAAYLDNQSYGLLQEMSDRFGGRITGSSSNEKSMKLLQEALRKEGISSRQESFAFPGWIRKIDEAKLIAPIERPLRAAALGYVQSHPTFEAEVVFIGSAQEEDIAGNVKGKIGLVAPNVRLTTETIDRLSQEHGLKGLLLINRKNGGQLLARTQNINGEPSPIPAFAITEEEGLWLKRLAQRGESPWVQLTTRSNPKKIKTANLVATLQGKVEEKIVIGAHFDSWDLGQGALDNGLGIAQLFDTIRHIKATHPKNHYTIEFVWFNAEEFGLFGSHAYIEKHRDEKIVAMLNLDMVGNPIGINAMGFDALVPFLENFSKQLNAFSFSRPLENKPWLGSDHMPFIINGIPSITFYAPIKAESAKFYHDFGDTFEKVDKTELSKSIAIVTLLAYELANNTELRLNRLSQSETIDLLRKAKLENRMKQAGIWSFEE